VVKFKEPYTTAMALADKDRRLFVTAPVSFYDPTAFGEVYEMKNPAFAGD
jgi:hypothetical protein